MERYIIADDFLGGIHEVIADNIDEAANVFATNIGGIDKCVPAILMEVESNIQGVKSFLDKTTKDGWGAGYCPDHQLIFHVIPVIKEKE